MSMIRNQPVVNGATSKSFYLFLEQAGAPVISLTFATASLLASYAGSKLARVAITLADLAAITTAWASGGFKEVDATNMPGWYRLDLPNAALALSADEVVVTIYKSGVVYGGLCIPIPTKTVATIEAKVDIVDSVQDANVIVVNAIAAGIPQLDVVSTATTRTNN